MYRKIKIGKNTISQSEKTYIIAEMSANHNMDFERAKTIVRAAADSGANAIKLQTYTADTITVDCKSDIFMTKSGLWEGQTLYELYGKAYTPWEWHDELMEYAKELGIDCFSSPFDFTAVDFLEKLQVPAYKIASFEITDIPLIKKVARTKKPVIISTGIANLEEIDVAVRTCKEEGNNNIVLLKCVSAYPAPFEEMNLSVIPNLSETFGCISGLSDHTLGSDTAIAAVTLGAKVIEKHLTIRRNDGGVDSAFSMEPCEFEAMVNSIRNVEKAIGKVDYKLSDKQIESRHYSRSLFVVDDMKQGDIFTMENMRSIRPGCGMNTKYYEDILGKKAKCDICKGTPMNWNLVE